MTVLWTPPPDVFETTEIGRFAARNGFTSFEDVRRAEVAAITARLPTVEHVIQVAYGDDADAWSSLLSGRGPLEFEPVHFAHPLYVLFSSGTTGLPKAVVHGHGGILVEHVKNLGLGWDLKPGGRLFWFTTTAWMMWNALVSALLLRSSIVMLDGDPAWPDLAQQWRLAAETRPTVMGVGPAFVMACRKAGLTPGRDFDLSSTCIVTGRSDATPNRGGVRLGTSEFYAVIEDFPEVEDSLVVHLEDPSGGPGDLLLFVVAELDDGLRGRIAGALRSQLSPRHVPDTIAAVPAIPRTLTGKKLETPVKRILRGEPAEAVASRGALADPDAIAAFVEFADNRRP